MLTVSLDHPQRCPYCHSDNTKPYRPDNQGEMWLACQDCHKMAGMGTLTISLDHPQRCPYCRSDNTKPYGPDDQGKMWLACQDCYNMAKPSPAFGANDWAEALRAIECGGTAYLKVGDGDWLKLVGTRIYVQE